MKCCSRDGCATTIDGDAKYCTAICRDHDIDRPHCVACVDHGRAEERAAIVAWLRRDLSDDCSDAIDAIERGEHLQPGEK